MAIASYKLSPSINRLSWKPFVKKGLSNLKANLGAVYERGGLEPYSAARLRRAIMQQGFRYMMVID